MPILTSKQLATLQTNVQEAIMAANTDLALKHLEEVLPVRRAKHNQIVLLMSRQSEIVLHTVNNTLSEEQLEVMRNNLTADILLFTTHLTTADFEPKPAQRPGLKPGHLLYQVPTMMVLQQTYDCLVRVAEELSQVMEGIAKDEDVVIEDIGLTEVMEVEILDAGGPDDPAFDIMLLSDGEQAVDEYSYTEWVFNVRPLREGQHQLILKISVLLTIKGKERTKNVILRRPINVSAKATKEAQTAKFQRVVPLKTTSTPLSEEIIDTDHRAAPPKTSVEGERPKVIQPPTDRSGRPQMELDTSDGSTIEEELSVPSPAEESTPAIVNPPTPPSKTTTGGGLPNLPSPSPPPPRRAEPGRKSGRASFPSLATALLLLVFAGFWLVKSDGFENLMKGETPDVGTDGPDTLKVPSITIDSLKASKSLLPDSLQNE